jgi:tRNA(Ile)-lysidine synthase
LLGWRRAALRDLATAAAIPFVDDPSNRDAVFERARVRAALTTLDWLDPVCVAAAAAHAAEAEDALGAMAALLWRERATESGQEVTLIVRGLPRELRRRLAARAVATCAPGTPADSIEPLLDALDSGTSATQGDVLASAKQEIWHFRAAPPRRSHRSA